MLPFSLPVKHIILPFVCTPTTYCPEYYYYVNEPVCLLSTERLLRALLWPQGLQCMSCDSGAGSPKQICRSSLNQIMRIHLISKWLSCIWKDLQPDQFMPRHNKKSPLYSTRTNTTGVCASYRFRSAITNIFFAILFLCSVLIKLKLKMSYWKRQLNLVILLLCHVIIAVSLYPQHLSIHLCWAFINWMLCYVKLL